MENPECEMVATETSGDTTAISASALAGRRRVTGALLIAMMVTAVEQLVVSPAMPTIIADLKGFEIWPWVVSAFLLASTVSTPIYGKLADLFGRKPVLIFGLALFSLGSILSGTAHSMVQLIVMRSIQGLGAGAVGPIVITMLGDLFTLKERAQVQALFSAVWGLSSIGGPLLGGYLADGLGWRWVFLVCVPFAVAAIVMLHFFVSEPYVERKVAPIDWAGAILLTSGMSILLWVVLDSAQLGGPTIVASLGLSAALIFLFVLRERVAADPILPLDLMTQPTIAASLVGSALLGAILFGLDTYVPLFVQGVRGGNATLAGRSLMPLFLTWAVSVAVAAKAIVRFGFRRGGIVGSSFIMAGNLTLLAGAVVPPWSSLFIAVGLGICGLGMGPMSLSFVLAVQHAVSWGQRGVATGAAIFLRTIGGAIGVGLLGASLGWGLARRLASAGASNIDIVAALRPETHVKLSPEQLALVQTNLGLALRDVYLMLALMGVGCLVCALWLPGLDETISRSQLHERAISDDEGLAVAASEF
jgi:multidrug resistance protein